jgi:hypothetical protein
LKLLESKKKFELTHLRVRFCLVFYCKWKILERSVYKFPTWKFHLFLEFWSRKLKNYIYSHTSYDATLLAMNFINICLFLKVLMSPSILKNNFAVYSNLCWQIFSFRAWHAIHSMSSWSFEFLLRNMLLFWWGSIYK